MPPKLFGAVVSIVDNIIVVGAPSVGYKGSFHNFKILNSLQLEERDIDEQREKRAQISTLDQYSPKDGHIDDGFGISCKIKKIDNLNYQLIVGAHRHFEQGVASGAAYIYTSINKGQSWKYSAKLVPAHKTHKSSFGCSVDIAGDYAIVGAFSDNTEGWRVGAVHIFKFADSKWHHHKTLRPNLKDVFASKAFNYGFSLAFDDGFLAVGAPSDESPGSVFVYHSKEWDNDIDVHHIKNDNRFGFSVDITDNHLLVGSPGEHGFPGIAYRYELGDLFDTTYGFISAFQTKVQTALTNSPSSKPLFGRSVAGCGKFYVISGFGKTSQDKNVGSAFIYRDVEHDELGVIANLRDEKAQELFGHSVAISHSYVIVGDPSTDSAHVYILDNIVGSNVKKWQGSSIVLNAPDTYMFELS